MAMDLGSGARTRDVALNIVPFIDLMSCLTAFLLVTAVWVSAAQLDVHPEGPARGEACPDLACDAPTLSLLVDPDVILVGVSRTNEVQRIMRTHTDHDWLQLRTHLQQHKSSSLFQYTREIEVAVRGTADRPEAYQALVSAMDVALAAGFDRVALMDPGALSAF